MICMVAVLSVTAQNNNEEHVLDYFFPDRKEMRSIDPEDSANMHLYMYDDSDSTLMSKEYDNGEPGIETVNKLRISRKEIQIVGSSDSIARPFLKLPEAGVTETCQLGDNYIVSIRKVVIVLRIDGEIQEKEAIEAIITLQTVEPFRSESAKQYWVKGLGMALCVCSTCCDEEEENTDSVCMYLNVLNSPEYTIKTQK